MIDSNVKPNSLYSWNVNGLKAILRKNFREFLKDYNPEVICLQETKSQDDEVRKLLSLFDGYHVYCSSAERKGYSGTAIMTRIKPLDVRYGIDKAVHDKEGRTITLTFPDFYLVNVYVPNAGNGLKRLDYRCEWDADFRMYLEKLANDKPVILTGDLNVAHREIDIARPKQNYNKSAGYTQKEIDGFDALLNSGMIDTFRTLNPDKVKYSYWSYRAQARERNVGWRLDYFLASETLREKIEDTDILNDVAGSDHCPVVLQLKSR